MGRLEDILKSVEENKVANPPVRRNVYVADLDMTVNTDLETPDEINYATKTQVLEKPKQEYIGLKETENPFKLAYNASVDSLKNVLDKVVETVAPTNAREPFKEMAKGAVVSVANLGNLSWGATKIFATNMAMNREMFADKNALEQSYMRREITQEEYFQKLKELTAKKTQEHNAMREFIGKDIAEDNQAFNQWLQDCGFTPDSKTGKFFYDLGGSITSIGASVIAFAVTKNPLLAISLISVPEFTSTYTEAIEKGKDADTAMSAGLTNYAFVTGSEFLGGKVLWSTLSKSGFINNAIKKITTINPRLAMPLASGFEEGIQESSQEVGGELINQYYDISQLTGREIINNALYSGLQAFLGASLFGGVAGSMQFNKIFENEKKELLKLKDSNGNKLYTPEQADQIAKRTADFVQSRELQDEILNISKAERDNSLSKEARNPKEMKKMIEDNLKKMETALPEIKKELMDIKTKVKTSALETGIDEEQATMVAEMTQARAMMYYNAFGITPLQFYYLNELEITVDEKSNILSNGRETGYSVRFDESKVLQALSSENISNIIKSIRTKENLDKFGKFVNKLVNEGRLSKEQRSMIYSQLADRMNEIPTTEQVVDRVREEEVDNFNQAPQPQLQAEKEEIKQQAIANGTFMLAPNGKKSNLTEDLWLTVRTNNFKNWFGDWQNDPANASKVVDENGEPLVVYHGTNADFSVFKESFSSTNTGAKNSGIGFFFTPIRSYAEKIGGKKGTKNIMPLFLNIREPLEIGYAIKKDNKLHNGREQVAFDYNNYDAFKDGLTAIKKAIINKFGEYNLENSKKWKEEIKRQNVFDGLEIMTGDSVDFNATLIPVKQYVAFDANQIKSVNNNGMFNPNNSDIFYQPAYHGTPHRFDEFSTDKIGTGEGAQAHGWGLYFAKNRGVSERYRKFLSEGDIEFVVNGEKPDDEVRFFLGQREKLSIEDIKKEIQKEIERISAKTKNDNETVLVEKRIIEKLKNNIDKKVDDIKFDDEEEILVKGAIDGMEQDAMFDGEYGEYEEVRNTSDFTKHLLDYMDEIYRDDLGQVDYNKRFVNKLKEIKTIEKKKIGQVYQVEIPETDVLLDEQKTFEEQPEKVKEAIREIEKDDEDGRLYNDLLDTNEYGEDEIVDRSLYLSALDGVYKEGDTGATGKEIYNSIVMAIRDKYGVSTDVAQKEASLILNKYGIKGISYDGYQDGRAYVVFDDKAVKILEKFYQGERGQVIPRDINTPVTEQTKSIINVFSGGDRSTIIHEMAHIFLRDIEIIENQGGVQDEQFKKIKKTLDKWLGKKEGQKYTREQQEKFASGFETYMATGQAPKEELKGVFDYFKKWMSQIYDSVKNMIPITPEVKNMFDEILTLQPVEQTPQTQTEGGNNGNGNNGNIVPVTPDAKDLGKIERKRNTSIVDFANKYIQPISTRLGAIDPRLEYEMKMFEARLSIRQAKYKDASLDFLKQTDELKKKNKQDYLNFDRALKNRDVNTINRITEKYPELKSSYEKIREMLDGIKAELKVYGVEGIENYFPRKINNIDGLMSYLEGTDNWSEIERAMKQSDPNYKNWTEEKKAEFVASYLQGYRTGVKTKSAHTKQRKIDIVTDEMDRYYENSSNSLLEYINNISNFLETARLLKLGKDEVYEMTSVSKDGTINLDKVIKNIESILGTYVKDLVKDKKLTREQEKELAQLIRARFNFQNTNNIVSVIKSFGYLATLGNINAVITQFGDLSYSIDNAGIFGTLRAIFGKKKITMEDLGIDHPAEDFADGIGIMQKILNGVLKTIGFKSIDSLGKNTYIATTFMKYKSMIEKNEQKAFDDIARRYGDEFAKNIIDDIKNDRLSENIYLFAHSELSRVQPISMSEVPEAYLNSPTGRIFYSLKTFWIKQFNRIITDNSRLIKEGIKEKNAEKVKEGAVSMAKLIILFVVLGSGTDMLKDLIYLRKIDLEDTVFDNFLKLLGVSRYTVYKAREQGTWSVIADQIFSLPVGQMFDSFTSELNKVSKGKMKVKDLRIASNIPIVGNPYYWWLGGGRLKEKKKNKRRVL